MRQTSLPYDKNNESNDHAHPRRAEAPVPAEFFGKEARDHGAEECADVDAHVKNSEARVTARILLFIQAANQGGNIRFEKPIADNEQAQADMQQRRKRHGKMTERHHHTTDQNRAAQTQPAIGEIAAEYRGEIDQTGVGRVNRQRIAALIMQRIHQVQHQQRAHAVETKTFPHLGEK